MLILCFSYDENKLFQSKISVSLVNGIRMALISILFAETYKNNIWLVNCKECNVFIAVIETSRNVYILEWSSINILL